MKVHSNEHRLAPMHAHTRGNIILCGGEWVGGWLVGWLKCDKIYTVKYIVY